MTTPPAGTHASLERSRKENVCRISTAFALTVVAVILWNRSLCVYWWRLRQDTSVGPATNDAELGRNPSGKPMRYR